MANLQIVSRLASPLPLQSMPSLKCCNLRVSSNYSTNRERTSGAGSESSTAGTSHSVAGGWTKYKGSRNSLTERGKPRASVLETEAPLITESRRTDTAEAEEVESRLDRMKLGCRPIYEEEAGANVLDNDDWDEEAFRSLESRAALYSTNRSLRDLEICPSSNFRLDFAEFVNDVWREKATAEKYFKLALKKHPNDPAVLLQYAQFAWNTLGDLDRADELFCLAMKQEKSVHFTNVQATYAMFLWQTDV